MVYRYAPRRDDSDLASGRVLRSAPGTPGFPVRLASEIFQRATALRNSEGPVTLWDPCCGSGYLLTVLGLLHPERFHTIVATDVDEHALSLARANLALLTPQGLQERRQTLDELATAYGKPTHHEAVQAADRLLRQVGAIPAPAVRIGQADAFSPHQLTTSLQQVLPDLVITDVPYGQLTHWNTVTAPYAPSIPNLARSLATVVPPTTVVAITCRARRVPLEGLPTVSSFKVGHRSVVFLRAGDLPDHGTAGETV
ncbi:rRNA methyltransferase [Actinopolyspora saharensis]|uniref:rRNA methyltransferase n=1 Tax=Actinopolyspora saharensis TaxID=995062 RepID=UPI003F6740E8